MTNDEIRLGVTRIACARRVLLAASEALDYGANQLDTRFSEVVGTILALKGKVVLTGVGKSGIIARKIAATLASTGTAAIFLHSVEAVMGDLGILSRDDLLIAISASGETSEVVNVVIAAARLGTPAVAMTRNSESTLARECRYLLPIHVEREAGTLGLAPTTSTTVTLALGDALAIALKEERGFTREQFAGFHPGGNLGRRLALKVADIMRTGERVPIVTEDAPLAAALPKMSGRDALGSVLVTDATGVMTGIFTDGDLRRLLEKGVRPRLLEQAVAGFMIRAPKTVDADAMASEALRIMEAHAITVLPIVDTRGAPIGIIQLHDILGRGKLVL
ncbi:MAG: SIS domain-containing protein [Planctomycetota bacterium]